MHNHDLDELIALFDDAFSKLAIKTTAVKKRELALVVHQAMTVQARHFHTLEHVFTFVNPDNPIQSIAAMYHDIVYYQVDMGFAPAIWEMISAYIDERDDSLYLTDQIAPDDHAMQLALQIFDFRAGQALPSVGENEFLSAVVMNKQLGGLLSEKDLLILTLCIEATIPFRGKTSDELNHFEVLEDRLRSVCRQRGIRLEEPEIEAAVKLAVKFANKDTESFSEKDSARFISNTWKLLPEMNAALRAREIYSVREYRRALLQMEAFLRNLNPENVFGQYHGEPSDAEFKQMAHRARMNIAIANQYLRVKLLAAMILEALSDVTGVEAPFSLLMEDTVGPTIDTDQCEDFLPSLPDPPWLSPSSEIYQLMKVGRLDDTGYTMTSSPMGLFLLRKLPPREIDQLVRQGGRTAAGRLEAQAFLGQIDFSILSAIACACKFAGTSWGDALVHYIGSQS